jgi:glycosyltransferase involved in cell wall biosynthesis
MRRIVVTSPHTREVLARTGVPVERVRVAVPGTDPAPLARGTAPSGGPVHLLCVAPLVPRKGHEHLVDALAGVSGHWKASFAGSLTRDRETAARVRERIERHGIGSRVELLGEVEAPVLDDLFAQADVYVQPSLYEGYCMAISEAVARGLPIVSTRAGAIPGTAPAQGSLLVEPGDAAALSRALTTMINDPAHRERLAAGARTARERLLSWPEATARFAAELERP